MPSALSGNPTTSWVAPRAGRGWTAPRGRREALTSVVHAHRGRESPTRVAHGHADSPFARVDSEDPTTVHRWAAWGLGRQRRYEMRAAPSSGSCRPRRFGEAAHAGQVRARILWSVAAQRVAATRECQWSFRARRWPGSAGPLCARRPSARRGLPTARARPGAESAPALRSRT